MSNAILPHILLAVFAVGSTLAYCYDLGPIYDTNKLRSGGMERKEVRPPVSHVVVYILCSEKHKWGTVHTYAIFSGLHCSMETSRVRRVGTRNHIIRIAAVSQKHALVCIERKVTRPEVAWL